MARERLCEYGNCHNTNVAVTVNVLGDPAERKAFCCTQHAAAWLAVRDYSVPTNKRESIRATVVAALNI